MKDFFEELWELQKECLAFWGKYWYIYIGLYAVTMALVWIVYSWSDIIDFFTESVPAFFRRIRYKIYMKR